MTCAPLRRRHTGLQDICCYTKSVFITQPPHSPAPTPSSWKPRHFIVIFFLSPPHLFSPPPSVFATFYPGYLGGKGSIRIHRGSWRRADVLEKLQIIPPRCRSRFFSFLFLLTKFILSGAFSYISYECLPVWFSEGQIIYIYIFGGERRR